ncbi:MAG: hypothetical protein D6727_04635 [Gammaproteobacteria bacterium]|nr:MAG: hypothetical protein D6727_04635 [Gammaproteobacteria bacterium]
MTESRLRAALLVAVVLLAGCGLKGGLYLPEAETPAGPAAAEPAGGGPAGDRVVDPGDDPERERQRGNGGD